MTDHAAYQAWDSDLVIDNACMHYKYKHCIVLEAVWFQCYEVAAWPTSGQINQITRKQDTSVPIGISKHTLQHAHNSLQLAIVTQEVMIKMLLPVSASAAAVSVGDGSTFSAGTSLVMSCSREVKRSLTSSMLVMTTDISLQWQHSCNESTILHTHQTSRCSDNILVTSPQFYTHISHTMWSTSRRHSEREKTFLEKS